MSKKIRSCDHKNVIAKDFDVLADPSSRNGGPVVAIMVEPRYDAPFILPMDVRTARDLALMLIDTVLKVAPAVALEPMKKS